MPNFKQLILSIVLLAMVTSYGCTTLGMAGASVASAAVYSNSDRRTAQALLDDKTIEIKINKNIYLDKKIRNNSNITVTSFNGVVLITGQTINEDFRNKIHFTAYNTPKVRTIYNELTIDKPLSLKLKAKDTWITTKIKSLLIKEQIFAANQIKVVTEDGIVYLLGLVTPEEEQLATKVANSVSGVKSVIKIFEKAKVTS